MVLILYPSSNCELLCFVTSLYSARHIVTRYHTPESLPHKSMIFFIPTALVTMALHTTKFSVASPRTLTFQFDFVVSIPLQKADGLLLQELPASWQPDDGSKMPSCHFLSYTCLGSELDITFNCQLGFTYHGE